MHLHENDSYLHYRLLYINREKNELREESQQGGSRPA